MASSSDNSVEIRITGAIDPSLDASITGAIRQLDTMARSAVAAGATQQDSARRTYTTIAAACENAADEIRASYQKLGADLGATDQRVAQTASQTAKESADERVRFWESANRQILTVDDELARDLFAKRQNLTVDLIRIGQNFLEQELASDLKYWTERGLLALEGIEKEKMAQQGGMLQKLLFDQLDLSSTTTSETAKTAAVASGVASRVAAESAGNAQGVAIKAMSTKLSISQDAAKAAAGAYAALADIPIVGPALGAGAAVATFAAVMAYDSIASAEGGQWRVGGAEQLTMLHKDEMVLPAGHAASLRGLLEGGNFSLPRAGDTFNRSDSSQINHYWNYSPANHYTTGRSAMDDLRDDPSEFIGFVQDLARSGRLQFA